MRELLPTKQRTAHLYFGLIMQHCFIGAIYCSLYIHCMMIRYSSQTSKLLQHALQKLISKHLYSNQLHWTLLVSMARLQLFQTMLNVWMITYKWTNCVIQRNWSMWHTSILHRWPSVAAIRKRDTNGRDFQIWRMWMQRLSYGLSIFCINWVWAK